MKPLLLVLAIATVGFTLRTTTEVAAADRITAAVNKFVQ
jgi:hypothetical protein